MGRKAGKPPVFSRGLGQNGPMNPFSFSFPFLFLLLPWQQSRPASSTGEGELSQWVQEVFQGVQKETGIDLQGKIRVRWASPLEMAKVLTRDSLEFSPSLGPETLKKLRKSHRMVGNQLLGKYDWRNKEILISRSNLKRQARLFRLPQLLEAQTIKALITHECMHAVDQKKYAWVEKMIRNGPARIQMYNAVTEGHAQAVAEKICKAQGWEKGFKVFSSVIGKIPDNLSGLERQIVELKISQTRDAYWKGRSFVLAIQKALGEKGVKRIFDHPPQSYDEVLHPEWYLDPTLRPHPTFDPKPAFQALVKEMPREEWKARTSKASLSQLGAAMSLLPERERHWILESMQGNRSLVLMDRKNPQARLVILTFIQFKTDADAASYLDSALKLSKIKDKKMAKGVMRITGSVYDDLRPLGRSLLFASKTLAVGTQKMTVQDVFAQRKNLVLELLSSNHPFPKERILGLAQSLIQKVGFEGTKTGSAGAQPSSRPGLGK